MVVYIMTEAESILADLIWEKKDKNFIFYELNTSVLEELMLWISDLKGENNDDKKES